MIPVNPLGDAAAAETMVSQAIKASRPEKQDEILRFNQLLRTRLEEANLSVHPLHKSTDAGMVEESEEKEGGRRYSSSHQNRKSIFTPQLASERTDRPIAHSVSDPRHPLMGKLVDLKA